MEEQKDGVVVFPKEFLWGAATSAHQVEGNNKNQWTRWEKQNAKQLASEYKKRYSRAPGYDQFKEQGQDPNNYISGQASNHYEMYEADFSLAQEIGLNSFRFSIEWSRLEPTMGQWDEREFTHYKEYIKSMRAHGLEPVMTLFHFTLPEWFADLGDFQERDNIKYFLRFAKKVMEEFGDEITYIVTINEPNVYAGISYFSKKWPPARKSVWKLRRATLNLAEAHNEVARMIHARGDNHKVSISIDLAWNYAGDKSWLSKKAASVVDWFSGDYYLRRVAKDCDFIGLNFYLSNRFVGYRLKNSNRKRNSLGWHMQPADIQFALERLYKKYNLPVMVTENGLPDANDENREWWLKETTSALERVIKNDVELLGYIHWSLLDNFEWNKGFWPRFGLIEVDYKNNFRRTIRKSARWYGRFIKDSKSDKKSF